MSTETPATPTAAKRQRIAEIAERAEAATKGPWNTCDNRVDLVHEIAYRKNWEDDADFIAHARDDVPWLLSELAAAELRENAMRTALEGALHAMMLSDVCQDEIVAAMEDARDALAASPGADLAGDARESAISREIEQTIAASNQIAAPADLAGELEEARRKLELLEAENADLRQAYSDASEQADGHTHRREKAKPRRQMEIVDPSGNVSYRRPEGHPMIAEALRTPGYTVRPEFPAPSDTGAKGDK